MTREEARKAAEVMLAFANGEKIQYRVKGGAEWRVKDAPTFEWNEYEYRIKPKERFDPKTLQPFDRVLVFDTLNNAWYCDFYSHKAEERDCFPYMCIGNTSARAIPYNDDTKHLVGTNEEAPEFYRYWED